MMSKTMFRFTDVWVHSAHSTTLAAFSPLAPRQTTLSLWQQWSNKVLKTQAQAPLSSAHRRLLVKGASGALSSGQVTVLTGPSGSGKSILLQTLAGLLPMSCGEVFLHGEGVSNKLAPWSIHHTAPVQWRTQVALLTQHPQLLEGCVLDNLKMPYRLQAHQHLSFDINWHITQLKHLQRDARFLQKNTHHLSGGERQLTHTLRLLQLSPQVLLLDEPTAALDVVTSAQLIQLLTNWLRSDKRRTLLWVTHDTKDIMPHASQHWQMQAGVLTDIVV